MNTASRISRVVAALGAAAGLMLALPASAQIVASEGWVRATAPGADTGVGYLVLRNTGDEEQSLLRITSPVADEIRLHQSSVTAQGQTRLWPLSGLKLAPGETVRFEPNGRQLTFRGLKGPFAPGKPVPLQLHFDRGQGEFTVMLEVRPAAQAAGATPVHTDHAHHAHH